MTSSCLSATARSSPSTGSTRRSGRSPGWSRRSPHSSCGSSATASQRSELQTLACRLGVVRPNCLQFRVRPDRRAGGDAGHVRCRRGGDEARPVPRPHARGQDIRLHHDGHPDGGVDYAFGGGDLPRGLLRVLRLRRPRATSSEPSSGCTTDPKLAMSYATRAKDVAATLLVAGAAPSLLGSRGRPAQSRSNDRPAACRGRLPAIKSGPAASRSRPR